MRVIRFSMFLLAFIVLYACKKERPSAGSSEPVVIRDTVIKHIEVPKIIRDTIFQKVENANWLRQTSGMSLYAQCGNILNFVVDEDVTNLRFTASEAEVRPYPGDLRKVRVVPAGKSTTLTASQLIAGSIGPAISMEYNVINPPKPEIQFAVNGKSTNGMVPIPKSSRIALRLLPDNDFRSHFPEDARYRIGSISVYAQLSLGPPTLVNKINAVGKDATLAITIPLGTQIRQTRPGTKVYIKIDDVYRLNFNNQKIRLDFSEQELIFGLVVK